MPKHIFLSYCREDEASVAELRQNLIAAGENLWSVGDILPGQDWKLEIRRALEKAYAIIICFSENTEKRYRSGIFPELRNAIEIQRSQLPSHIFMIPVRFSNCSIPDFKIDATRSFSDLQFVDLFPQSQKQYGTKKLLKAIAAVHSHPSKLSQSASTVPEPEPVFPNERIRSITQGLEEARDQMKHLTRTDKRMAETKERILELRRQLREGGQRQPGEVLSERYKLIELLGTGGFAKVWKAYDLKKRRLVAVKMLHGQFVDDHFRIERFFRGAKSMSKLHHPGIVRVLSERCVDEGFHFFVMEYWDGGNFHSGIVRGGIDADTALNVIRSVGNALHFAHLKGLLHRDIKPSNILLNSEGHACLTDFDLIKVTDSTGGTRTRAGLGTFVYSAPEVMAEPKDTGVAADIYGLGMTAIFALHGKDLPFNVLRDPAEIINSLTCAPYRKKVLTKAVAWKPEERFSSVIAFCEALKIPIL